MKTVQHMEYAQLNQLRDEHPAWRLLAAEQCSFVVAFLYNEFVLRDVRSIVEEQLLEDLENYIIKLHAEGQGEDIVRPAREYLAVWCDGQHSWLRRFYQKKDEPCYDLTAAAQKAIEWLYSLRKQSFVGTESRIKNVVQLLTALDDSTNTDRDFRIMRLKEQRAKLDQEIAFLENGGEISLPENVQVREEFRHAAGIAREILGDFREVEENFRELERQLMENIITWKRGKGELLEKFFKDRDYIMHSDQGRSFAAFWEYITSEDNRQQLEEILSRLLDNDVIREENREMDISHIRRQWAQAASQVQKTVISLSRQIRQYVDEDYLNQERYIYNLIKSIEDKAIQMKEIIPRGNFMEMDQMSPTVDLIMDRPLFSPPRRPAIVSQAVEKGSEQPSVEVMFKQIYVDRKQLRQRITDSLHRSKQSEIPLEAVLRDHPLEKGLTELLTYMVIASHDPKGFTDSRDTIALGDEQGRAAECDRMVFHEEAPAPENKGKRKSRKRTAIARNPIMEGNNLEIIGTNNQISEIRHKGESNQ